MTARPFGYILLTLLFFAALSGVAGAREIISLDGEWQALASDAVAPPTADAPGWAPLSVPSVLLWVPEGPHALWYRKSFSLPASWGEHAVVLRVNGAKFAQRVFVNGKEVGQHAGGFEPTEYNLTRYVIPGERVEVCIRVQDWTALLAPEAQAAWKPVDGDIFKNMPAALQAPVGTAPEEIGISDHIWVERRARVYVDSVRVLPSVVTQTLQAIVTVKNASAYAEPATVRLRLQGAGVPVFAPLKVTVPAGGEQTVPFSAPWPQVALWWPQTPTLYTLTAAVENKWFTDSATLPFGFRDIVVRGDQLLLNGVPVHLLAVSAPHVLHGVDPTTIFTALQAVGVNAIELGGEPWPEDWYDAADATGMLVIADSALARHGDSYQINNVPFWETARAHVTAMAQHLRNHPSIIVWNVETELNAGSTHEETVQAEQTVTLAGALRVVDESRPILFGGEGDPEGQADIISLYRPHEVARWRAWPETASWINGAVDLDYYPKTRWQWMREKPLAIGKFIQLPVTDVNSASLLFGDTIYPQSPSARDMTEASLRGWQILALRQAGVNIIDAGTVDEVLPPNSLLAQMLDTMYAPLLAYDLSENDHAFAGTVVNRRIAVMNDSLMPRQLEVRWTLTPLKGEWEVTGQSPLAINAGGHETVEVALPIPALSAPVPEAIYALELWEGDRRISHLETAWRVFGRDSLSGPIPGAPKRVVVYDPYDTLTPLLTDARLSVNPLDVADITAGGGDIRGSSVLLLGEGSIDANSTLPADDPIVQSITEFVRNGGTLVIFAQSRYLDFMPVRLTENAPSVVFIRDPDHPLLYGVTEADFAHWVPEGPLTHWQIVKPQWGGFRTLVDSGGPEGLATAGVGEMRYGKGRVILCQLELASRYGYDPSATKFARNLLAYSNTPVTSTDPVGLFCDDATVHRLEAIGVRGIRLLDEKRLPVRGYQTLLISDFTQVRELVAEVQAFVRRGGRVILHNITPANVEIVARLLGGPVTVKENEQGAVRVIDFSGPARGLSNEDLAWFTTDDEVVTLSPRLASYTVDLPSLAGVTHHTDTGILLSLPEGRGLWIIDQVCWDDPGEWQLKADRYIATLLQNEHVEFALGNE